MATLIGVDGEPESEFSVFYQLYKTDENESVWQSSSLFNMGKDGEVLFKFIVYGIAMNILATVGVVGNLLSIVVLSRKTMKSPIGCFLIGLAACDLFVSFIAVACASVPSILVYFSNCKLVHRLITSIYTSTLMPGIYAVATTAYTGSIYFTLAVAVERYIAVCHPLKAKVASLTYRDARYMSAGIAAFAIVYNVPRWFEYKVVEICYPSTNEILGYRPVPTELLKNPIYEKCYVWVASIVFLFWIPMAALSYFNIRIYREIRKARKARQVLSPTQGHQDSLSKALLMILTMSSLCNVVVLLEGIYRASMSTNNNTPLEIECLRVFVFISNSSVNFIIYCFMGRRFRLAFWELLASLKICCCFRDNSSWSVGQRTWSKYEQPDTVSQRTSSFSISLPGDRHVGLSLI